MAATTDHKNTLIRDLREARERFDVSMRGVRRGIDLPARTKRSFQKRMPIWLSGALAFGWLLSKIPARKRREKIYVDRDEIEVKRVVKAGLLVSLLKLIFSAAKPAILAYATKRISDLATSQKRVEQKVQKVDRKVEKVDRQTN